MLNIFKITKIKRFPRLIFGLPILLSFIFAFSWHKEYYSLTKIAHNSEKHTLEITIRLFTDDMALSLDQFFQKKLELGTKRESADTNYLLEKYIKQHFYIKINNKEVQYSFVGKEFEKNEMYVYFEISEVVKLEQIDIQNSLLMDYYSEQENIVKISANKQYKTMLLNNRNRREVVFFD